MCFKFMDIWKVLLHCPNLVPIYSFNNILYYLPALIIYFNKGDKVNMGFLILMFGASLVARMVKNLPAMQERPGLDSWIGKIWSRKWQPTPVFLPGEFHGQSSLTGYSLWGLYVRVFFDSPSFFSFIHTSRISSI